MKERTVMLTVIEKIEKLANVEKLAKDKHGDHFLAALWGSAQCFLTEEDIKVMENVFGKEK